nr:PREDICTED: mucin-5AC isoform X1 [Bemisia tabaci]
MATANYGFALFIQLVLVTWISAQQGQNFFFTNTVGQQQPQFTPQFQQQPFVRDDPSASQFSNFFPRTNSGPFSPYRATVPSYQEDDLQTSDIPSQFPQIQGFSVPTTYQLPPRNSNPAPVTFENSSPVRAANAQSRQNYQDTSFRTNPSLVQSFGTAESPTVRQEQTIRNSPEQDRFKFSNTFKTAPGNSRTTQSFGNVQQSQAFVDSLSPPRNRWRGNPTAQKTESQSLDSDNPLTPPVGTRIPIPVKNSQRDNVAPQKEIDEYEFEDNSEESTFLRPAEGSTNRARPTNSRPVENYYAKQGKTPQEVHEAQTKFLSGRPELRFRPTASSTAAPEATTTAAPKTPTIKSRFPSSRERNTPTTRQPPKTNPPPSTSAPRTNINRGFSRFNPTTQNNQKAKEVTKQSKEPEKPLDEELDEEEEGEDEEFYEDDESQFDILPMHKDQTLVSDDNFAEFVDSGSIDVDTPQLSKEEKNKEVSDEKMTVSVQSSVTTSKRPASTTATPSVKEPKKEQGKVTIKPFNPAAKTNSPTTESWVIVASVQTSRSVSGARFLPSGAIKQEEQIQPLLPKGSGEVKTESTVDPGITDLKETPTTARSTTEVSTESIIDKLDRVQSDLSSGVLLDRFQPASNKPDLQVPDFGNEKQEKSSTTTSTTAATTVTTTTTPKPTTTEEASTPERKFSPFSPKFTTSPRPSTKKSKLSESIQFEDVSGLLPPGFKQSKIRKPITTTTEASEEAPKQEEEKTERPKPKKNDTDVRKGFASKIKFDDVSALLPPGYKPPKDAEPVKTSLEDILKKVKPVDVSNFLPANFTTTTAAPASTTAKSPLESLFGKIQFKDVSSFLPPGVKLNATSESEEKPAEEEKSTTTTTTRKPPRSKGGQLVLPPKIQKGWPQRSTTEFTGWPTPPTTPISVEKLIEAAKAAAATQRTETTTEVTSTTSTTTTTTTTTRAPTTPGYCTENCDLAATIKLVGGAKWSPELLDHNTKEYQTLANEVKHQLEILYSTSEELSRWYKKITIDAFSEGSVLVDYFVELNELGRSVNTADLKRLFHNSLLKSPSNSNLKDTSQNEPLQMGNFMVDPKHIDFVVLQRQIVPQVAMAEEDMWLPQWAIAVTVVGLGSLLFVVIFGVCVLISRSKNTKKQPTPMTEDMLHELNKNHMNGVDNYGASEDIYNMEDVWNDTSIKKRSSYETSMSNLYDSWRSDWHGYSHYYDGSSHSGYTHRPPRADYLSRHPDYDNDF